MGGLVWALLAVALATVMGAYIGRSSERSAVQSGKVNKGIRPLVDFEGELRKSRGAHRLHANPEGATRVKKLFIRR